MNESVASLFQPVKFKHINLKNKIIRSATYEGCGDQGEPTAELIRIYSDLARGGIGAIITGFVYVSEAGHAMQPKQCGIDRDDLMPKWQQVVSSVKSIDSDVKLIMQISHAGRQTLNRVTHLPVLGASSKRCSYFRQKVLQLTDKEIKDIINEYALAAHRAKQAGFDGIQIHGAHGYLVHQFLSPWTNTRHDCWKNKTLFLEEIIKAIRKQCGKDYPILIKLSARDDNQPGLRLADTINIVKVLENYDIDAVEISYGTMEYAFNIIRGNWPINLVLKINPIFNRFPSFIKWALKKCYFPYYKKKLFKFTENYNVRDALAIQQETTIPVIPVGGIRSIHSMNDLLEKGNFPAIALCRPLICEPDLFEKVKLNHQMMSRCTNCNLCTVYCDSDRSLQCYRNNTNESN